MLHKNAVRFVLGWNSLDKIFIFSFWVGICMGGTLKTLRFVISSTKLSLEYKIADQNCHQFCFLVKSVEQNWTNSDFALFSRVIWKIEQNHFLAKLRLEVLFKKFHPRINPATLSTKSYLLNMIKIKPWKPFLYKISKTFTRGYP
jgi:hypothetical protein